jgi:hypothetical protein
LNFNQPALALSNAVCAKPGYLVGTAYHSFAFGTAVGVPGFVGFTAINAKNGVGAAISNIYERTEQRNYTAPNGHFIYADPTY